MSNAETEYPDRIPLPDEESRAFAAIAQRAIVRSTYLPSGYLTPPLNYRIEGTDLVRARDLD